MKYSIASVVIYNALILLGLGTLASAQNTSSWEPKAYSIDRYEKAWARNPFNLKTAVAEKPKADFAKDLVVAGVATLGDKRRIWLQNIRTKEYIRIGDGIENDADIELIDLEKNPDPKKVVVRVSNGSMEAEVTYDEAALGGSGGGAAGGGNAARPGNQPQQNNSGTQARRRILLPGEGRSAQRIRLPSPQSSSEGDNNTGPSNVQPTSGNATDRRQRTVPEPRDE